MNYFPFYKVIIIHIFLLQYGLSQNDGKKYEDCENVPDSSARIFCNQLHEWDETARSNTIKAQPVSAGNPIFTKPPATKALRKEYRQLSDAEKLKVDLAFVTIKVNGEYDKLVRYYIAQPEVTGNAHGGPGYLPWHREFLKRVELLLRKEDPYVSLPYIDMTMDAALDIPKQSILFSEHLVGDTDKSGVVKDGPFQDWSVENGKKGIRRNVGEEGKGYPITDGRVEELLNGNLTTWLGYSVPKKGCFIDDPLSTAEYAMGDNQIFIGGTARNILSAPYDPLSIMSWAFMDMLWEQWRQTNQSPADRETVYPSDEILCESHHHYLSEIMHPFGKMTVKDGLSNSYTDKYYGYAPRPTCTARNQNGCQSKFLFCDMSYGEARCTSKLKLGGDCSTYHNGEKPCYEGQCIDGVCQESGSAHKISQHEESTNPPLQVEPATNRNTETPIVEVTPNFAGGSPNPLRPAATNQNNHMPVISADLLPPSQPRVTTTPRYSFAGQSTTRRPIVNRNHPNQETCYNELKCCIPWANNGHCFADPYRMRKYCKASCGFCKPTQYTLADDCSDRHPDCMSYAKKNECVTHPFWMQENCRRSCNLCAVSRFEECYLGRQNFGPQGQMNMNGMMNPNGFWNGPMQQGWGGNQWGQPWNGQFWPQGNWGNFGQ